MLRVPSASRLPQPRHPLHRAPQRDSCIIKGDRDEDRRYGRRVRHVVVRAHIRHLSEDTQRSVKQGAQYARILARLHSTTVLVM